MKNALQQKHTVCAGENTRNYGIDLLKILSMLLVALLHVLGQGGILSAVGAEVHTHTHKRHDCLNPLHFVP